MDFFSFIFYLLSSSFSPSLLFFLVILVYFNYHNVYLVFFLFIHSLPAIFVCVCVCGGSHGGNDDDDDDSIFYCLKTYFSFVLTITVYPLQL